MCDNCVTIAMGALKVVNTMTLWYQGGRIALSPSSPGGDADDQDASGAALGLRLWVGAGQGFGPTGVWDRRLRFRV